MIQLREGDIGVIESFHQQIVLGGEAEQSLARAGHVHIDDGAFGRAVETGREGDAFDAFDTELVDDLTETAGTLTTGSALLKKKGAKKIYACVSHALLNDLGIERLRKSDIDELITTDTVLRPPIDGVKITTLSVAGLLGEAIKRIHNNSSITSLFEFKGARTS